MGITEILLYAAGFHEARGVCEKCGLGSLAGMGCGGLGRGGAGYALSPKAPRKGEEGGDCSSG